MNGRPILTSSSVALEANVGATHTRAIAGRRIGAVGVLAALAFAVTFAIGASTKTHANGGAVGQPAPATTVLDSKPAHVTAVLAAPAVPALKHVTVKKTTATSAGTGPSQTQTTAVTAITPAAVAPVHSTAPAHTTSPLGGGGGTQSLGGGGGTQSLGGG